MIKAASEARGRGWALFIDQSEGGGRAYLTTFKHSFVAESTARLINDALARAVKEERLRIADEIENAHFGCHANDHRHSAALRATIDQFKTFLAEAIRTEPQGEESA